ncbi:MAG: lysine 5,6-aminomutase subunit alpha, partial [Candidatus Limnocylindrales bacterium]
MALSLGSGELVSEREQLLDAARALTLSLARDAERTTTLGRERAILRLLGVGGLDREGRPLAAEVIDRYVSGDPGRLAGGIGLPFAAALLEYETTPQLLALDVAAGTIDLALEAELLDTPERLAAATDHLASLLAAAIDQVDANRVARRELLSVLRDVESPRIGTTLRSPDIEDAEREAAALVSAGLDVLRVEVPVIRELATRLGIVGHATGWPPRDLAAQDEPVPAGSQRGLARLRATLDEAAAARGAYVRLITSPSALAGPEAAVVAALERVDILDLDPMADIVVTGVDPQRALTDFAFAVRVARRAGVAVLLDAGPLVVAPDLSTGLNADSATRSGRALALQIIAATLATEEGLPADQVLIGAIPGWLTGEPDSAAREAAEVALRRSLFAAHPLAFVEPEGEGSADWPAIVAAIQPGTGVDLILRRAAGSIEAAISDAARARSACDVARDLETSASARHLEGMARDHAKRALVTAIATVRRIQEDGWAGIT